MTIRKQAEPGFGGDAYPASQPQYVEDHGYDQPHDEPDYEPGTADYNFIYGNGQLHVSPDHEHEELQGHAGIDESHTGPFAAGRVHVLLGSATWAVDSNVAIRGLFRVLQDYTKHVGWKWGGLTDLEGEPIDDDFAPKKAVRVAWDKGHLFIGTENRSPVLGHQPDVSTTVSLMGKTAYVAPVLLDDADAHEALQEWGHDLGYRIADRRDMPRYAEYPGGSDMNDLMNKYDPHGEPLDQYNRGDNKGDFPEVKEDNDPPGTFKCPHCREIFPNWKVYQDHRREEDKMDTHDPSNTDEGYFPELNMDVPLTPHYHEKRPFILPLASVKEAKRYDEYRDYEQWLGLDNEGIRILGAFRDGFMRGFVAIGSDEVRIVRGRNLSTRVALLRAAQLHYPSLRATDGAIDREAANQATFIRTAAGYTWAAGSDPKDQIDAHVPFIFDVQEDRIEIGYPGERHSDIPGKFTPGGIVEGTYEPGGKVIIRSMTNMPYTVRHMVDLWYWMHPQMEVTSVELQDNAGNTTKLASSNVGEYIRTIANTDPAVWNAYEALRKEGGEVYVVGGAVRDALLQKTPKDIDLMVAGLPSEVVNHVLEKLPGRVDLTGKNFGVYRYRTHGHEVEIALPRTEKSTGDRRVHFDVNVDHELPVEDDLLRRDFTVNAMAVDLNNGELIDPYGGAEDIEHRKLRTTHPSSFREDPTRLVRALVMAGRYGFVPDEETRKQISENARRLSLESPDAVQPILDKLLSSHDPARAIRLAHETGLLKHILPEVDDNWDFDQNNPHHSHTLGEHLNNVFENMASQTTDPDLRLAALLHDIGKPASAWRNPETGFNHYYRGKEGQGDNHETVGADMAEKRLRELKWPVARTKRIRHIIEHHMWPAFSSKNGARKFINRVGDEHADDLLTFRWADQHGKGQTPAEIAARTSVDQQRGLVEQVRSAQEPTNMSALSINGSDIIQMGVKPGPEIGKILRLLTDDVIEDPSLNDRDRLMERAQEYANAIPTG